MSLLPTVWRMSRKCKMRYAKYLSVAYARQKKQGERCLKMKVHSRVLHDKNLVL
jgi:hypothetical protein